MLAEDLSLHILAKNEEALLPRLLERMDPYVSDIVITDTGSTDTTIALALAAGARICQTTLERGFGEARNVGLSRVTLPWVIQVDADEWPSDELLQWLTGWVPNAVVGGVWIRRHNLVGGKAIGERTFEWHPRIFRSGYRFVGLLHEHPEAPYETFVRAPEECLLLHYKTVVRQERQNAFYATF